MGHLRADLQIAESGWANGQPKEVCDWARRGPLSGLPLGSRTGASPNGQGGSGCDLTEEIR